jgi:hypothetical protein
VPAPVPYANLANPQTLNLYSMVADDPESFADLDGHMFWAPYLGNGPIGNISFLIASGAGPSELSQGLSFFGSGTPKMARTRSRTYGFGLLDATTGACWCTLPSFGFTVSPVADACAPPHPLFGQVMVIPCRQPVLAE